MFVKQLSVFVENTEGRLEQITKILKNNNINIITLSLADTNEYGMVRMIVSDPIKGKEMLKQAGLSAMLTDVVAVKLPSKVGMLHKLLSVMEAKGVNIEYMYTLATGLQASVIIKTNTANMPEVLKESGFEIFSENEVCSFNS